jgi:signal transduction histidine kinase
MSRRFAIILGAALCVIFVSMMLLGLRLQSSIRQHAMDIFVSADAHYAQTVLGAVLLGEVLPLDVEDIAVIEELLRQSPMNRDVKAAKIWLPDGTVVYSTDPAQIGAVAHSPALARALKGLPTAQLDDPADEDGAMQAKISPALIEIYVPIFDASGEVVYVAEFYHDAGGLLSRLRDVATSIWLNIALATAGLLFLLLAIATGADVIIRRQQARLQSRFLTLKRLAKRSLRLKRKADAARSDTIRNGQEFLSSLGTHLHDGPVQLIALLILRLSGAPPPQQFPDEKAIAFAQRAMAELRSLAEGLILPELEGLSTRGIVALAVDRHRAMTGTDVALRIDGELPVISDDAIKICLYRVVQEGLNNSFKHAAGEGQAVAVLQHAGELVVEVTDGGSQGAPARSDESRLGLLGMRRHVTSISGSIQTEFRKAGGLMRVRLPVSLAGAGRALLKT